MRFAMSSAMDGTATESRARLTPDDITFCVRACAFLRLPASPPAFFRDFLTRLADEERPDLAAKLRGRTGPELAELYEYVRDLQLQVQ
jgi:hypothetical protein